MAEQVVEEVAEAQTQEHLTTHDQAYWDQYLSDLGERWSALKTTAMQERTDVEKAEWDAFVWQTVVDLIHIVRQQALEKPVVADAKPARKRAAKVPKAAMPEVETPEASEAA